MKEPTDKQVYDAFWKHVKSLEARAIGKDGKKDKDAILSLACMALLAEGFTYNPDGDGDGEPIPVGNVIDFAKWRNAA